MLNLPIFAVNSQLVVIDVQTKPASKMAAEEVGSVVEKCAALMETANLLGIPIIVTEHYPVDFGKTLPELVQHFNGLKPVAKISSSAFKEDKFKYALQEDRRHIVLVGLEAHLCIWQTAVDLVTHGWHVHVVDDAVISQQKVNKDKALKKSLNSLVEHGCMITDTEPLLEVWTSEDRRQVKRRRDD